MAPPSRTPSVVVVDEQSVLPVEVGHLADLAARVLEAEDVTGAAELSLSFVDAGTITECNRRYLGGDGPTDVLAFPIDPDGPGDHGDAALPRLLGDVMVCPEVARRNAGQAGTSTADELALLVVHGTLHVLGWDHAEADDALAMQARERDLLDRFHRAWRS